MSAPDVVAFTVSWLALDLVAYVEHRLKHRIPLLWRIHRLHHSDPDVDVTTTLRFHPFEVLLRTAVRGVVATAIGMPPIAAVAYSLLMAAVSVPSHANIRQPGSIWRTLGLIVITPDFHRTHHSIDRDDCNSNFGLLLSCWDRLFGTYRSTPMLGHENPVRRRRAYGQGWDVNSQNARRSLCAGAREWTVDGAHRDRSVDRPAFLTRILREFVLSAGRDLVQPDGVRIGSS